MQVAQKKFLLVKMLKTLYQGYIGDLNGEEIVGTFYEKELRRTNQAEFRVKKIGKKVINYM